MGDGFVSAYLNQGDLRFERAYDFSPGVLPNRLIATALNAREPVDVVAASSADHRIAVLLNASRVSRDCNLNQRPDGCDITSRRSDDCNRNAVPDECDVALRVDFSPRIFAAPCDEGAMFYDPQLLMLGLNRDTHTILLNRSRAAHSRDANADARPDECTP